MHDTDVITFNDNTGEVYITTSQSTYTYTKMSMTITCTSDESIHMQPLRTVTDTFTVNFISDTTVDCNNSFDAYVFESYVPEEFQTYTITQDGTPKSMMPEFWGMSMDCPTICTLYDAVEGMDIYDPTSLPVASDPSFYSFDQFTGELVISTTNVAYSGNVINLVVECAASRMWGGYFSYPLSIYYNIPNGCTVNFDSSSSMVDDQMLVWGEQLNVPAFAPYTYVSDVCDGYGITYEAMQFMPNGNYAPLPQEIQFNPITRKFTVTKCLVGHPSFDTDIECTSNMMPYTKAYDLVIIATLKTDIQTFTDNSNRFHVVITPDCRADTL